MAPSAWRPCNASSRCAVGPGHPWTCWPTTTAPRSSDCATAPRPHRAPPPTTRPCWARTPTMPKRSTPKRPSTTKRTAAPSLHENVTAALRTLGVALAPGALDAALSAAERRGEVPRADEPGGVRLELQRQGPGPPEHRAPGHLRLRAAARGRDPGRANRPGEKSNPPIGGPRRVRARLPGAIRDQRETAEGVHRGPGRRDLRADARRVCAAGPALDRRVRFRPPGA